MPSQGWGEVTRCGIWVEPPRFPGGLGGECGRKSRAKGRCVFFTSTTRRVDLQSRGVGTSIGKTGLECGDKQGLVFGHVGFQMPERGSLEPLPPSSGARSATSISPYFLRPSGCWVSRGPGITQQNQVSDSLSNAPPSSSPPGFFKEPDFEVWGQWFSVSFFFRLTTTLWEYVLFHNSY